VSGQIQSQLQNLKNFAVNEAKRYAKDKAQEVALDLIADSITRFIPGGIYLEFVEKAGNAVDQGLAFDDLFTANIAEYFKDVPFADKIWLQAQVNASNRPGYPEKNGI
jgi:hypothetical protein